MKGKVVPNKNCDTCHFSKWNLRTLCLVCSNRNSKYYAKEIDISNTCSCWAENNIGQKRALNVTCEDCANLIRGLIFMQDGQGKLSVVPDQCPYCGSEIIGIQNTYDVDGVWTING